MDHCCGTLQMNSQAGSTMNHFLALCTAGNATETKQQLSKSSVNTLHNQSTH